MRTVESPCGTQPKGVLPRYGTIKNICARTDFCTLRRYYKKGKFMITPLEAGLSDPRYVVTIGETPTMTQQSASMATIDPKEVAEYSLRQMNIAPDKKESSVI